jgi:hypothetical protein
MTNEDQIKCNRLALWKTAEKIDKLRRDSEDFRSDGKITVETKTHDMVEDPIYKIVRSSVDRDC